MKKSSRFFIIGTVVLNFLVMICISGMFACVWGGNNAGGAFSFWPDTGQDKCFDYESEIPCPAPGEPFFGQDAQYQGPVRSYTKLGPNEVELPDSATPNDGWIMTRDNVTGLIWEVKTDDGSIHDKNNTYTWCDTNPDTNGGNWGECGDGTDTEDFIQELNSINFGGYADWRLPTIKELSTLVNINVPSSSPYINIIYFPNTVSSCYWSSTASAFYQDYAWFVHFDYGKVATYYKSYNRYVRAVRGGQNLLQEHFVDNQDGTITDMATGLMWQKCSMGQSWNATTGECDGSASASGWQSALKLCDDMSLSGYDDWRLPNRNELQTIIDYTTYNPSINGIYFPNSMSSMYWSSTTIVDSPLHAWSVYFYQKGRVSCEWKWEAKYVRAVRGKQHILSVDSDQDGDVDGYDLLKLAKALTAGVYDASVDFYHDNVIDKLDLQILALRFGW